MKKIISILLMLLMTLSIVSVALAEDEKSSENQTSDQEDSSDDEDETEQEVSDSSDDENETEDLEEQEVSDTSDETSEEQTETEDADSEEETQQQTESMDDGIGAEIRLLQLEKAVTRNILRAEEIISTINENGNDTTALESILSEMESLKTEIQALDPKADDAVQHFVDLKSDAIELSKEFRETAKPLLKDADKEALKNKFKEMDRTQLTDINNEIKNKIKSHNIDAISTVITKLGMDQSLITQLESGAITMKDLRNQIKETLKNMTKEEKKQIFADLKESGIKKSVFVKSAFEKAKVNSLERKEERLTKRLNKSEEIENENRKEKVQERLNKQLEDVNEKLEKAAEKQQEKNENRTKNRGEQE